MVMYPVVLDGPQFKATWATTVSLETIQRWLGSWRNANRAFHFTYISVCGIELYKDTWEAQLLIMGII